MGLAGRRVSQPCLLFRFSISSELDGAGQGGEGWEPKPIMPIMALPSIRRRPPLVDGGGQLGKPFGFGGGKVSLFHGVGGEVV